MSEHGKVIYQGMIPLEPISKKNHQQIWRRPDGSPFVQQSPQYRQYERESGWFLRKIPVAINEEVNIRAVFYRGSERRCDLTNLLEALDDILVKYGIILDDNWKILKGHDGSTVVVDRNKPRTEFWIERWQP